VAALLLGTYFPKLDDKGRLILPAKFWDEFQHGVVITHGQDGCLYLYSQREFEGLYARMQERLPRLGRAGRDYVRTLLGGATQEVPDAQRRITIPPLQREYAGLERELTAVGIGNHVELWDSAAWGRLAPEAAANFAQIDGEVIADLF